MNSYKQQTHCGLVVNYQCNAACRHCLYACSPERNSDYMSVDTANRITKLLKEKGINTLHVGGGEPFLNFKGLLKVIDVIYEAGMEVEYVETNGFWATNDIQVVQNLKALERAGVKRLLISLDPFHAEYVPVRLPLSLAEICEKIGFDYFLWQEQFRKTLACLEVDKVHSRADMEKEISSNYFLEAVKNSGVNIYAGRAINIIKEFCPRKPVKDILAESQPCHNLLQANFLHVDLYEQYIMPTCTGITIPLVEAVKGISQGRYKVFETLAMEGVVGLLKFIEENEYEIREEYASQCVLCFEIRQCLSKTGNYPELNAEYYEAALKYY